MKFRRILAAVLTTLMMVSAMSFTASVSAAEESIIKQSFLKGGGLERGKSSTKAYDEETGIGYVRLIPSDDLTANGAKSSYINLGSQNVKLTAEQIAADDVYIVFYVRTNMTLDDNDIPALSMYTTHWGTEEANYKKDGNGTLVTDNENFGTKVGSDWTKICFKVQTTATIDTDGDKATPEETLPLYNWGQIPFFVVGGAGAKPISEWYSSVLEGEVPYIDYAGYVVVETIEAAENFDIEAAAAAPKVTLTFDANNADDDSDITSYTTGTTAWNLGATVDFPEITAPSEDYEFVGWFTDAEYQNKIEDTAAVTVPGKDTTYYALWQDNSTPPTFVLDFMTVNGLDASKFGADITAETIAVTLPYGWAKLEALGVMPEVTVQATAPAFAEYVAGATLAEGGKIKFTQGNYTDEVDVTFTVGTAKDKKNAPSAGVYSTNGKITLPDGTEINADNKIRAVGTHSEKTTFKGVEAYKHTPIYKGSDLDGTLTKEGGTEYYTSNRSVNLEGYSAFGLYDYESYEVYRALCYIDTGANGNFDVVPQPLIYFQSSDTTGTYCKDKRSQHLQRSCCI